MPTLFKHCTIRPWPELNLVVPKKFDGYANHHVSFSNNRSFKITNQMPIGRMLPSVLSYDFAYRKSSRLGFTCLGWGFTGIFILHSFEQQICNEFEYLSHLSQYITLAICLDNMLCNHPPSSQPLPSLETPEPMQIAQMCFLRGVPWLIKQWTELLFCLSKEIHNMNSQGHPEN